MSYITTFTGKHFDPIHPVPEKIDMKDIAHALSLICRANGHTRFFYSVAQHSIACCKEAKTRGLSNHIQLGCLLHDSCETYMSNVTRPIKAKLTEYLKLEAPYKIRFGIIGRKNIIICSIYLFFLYRFDFCRIHPKCIN